MKLSNRVLHYSHQFKHKRMNEPLGNLEITNPIYTGYDDDDGGPDFGEDFDSDKVREKNILMYFI